METISNSAGEPIPGYILLAIFLGMFALFLFAKNQLATSTSVMQYSAMTQTQKEAIKNLKGFDFFSEWVDKDSTTDEQRIGSMKMTANDANMQCMVVMDKKVVPFNVGVEKTNLTIYWARAYKETCPTH